MPLGMQFIFEKSRKKTINVRQALSSRHSFIFHYTLTVEPTVINVLHMLHLNDDDAGH